MDIPNILFVYALFPVIWLAIASLKTNGGELMANPFSLPQVWQFQNYIKALTVSGISRLMLNSIVISLAATLLNVLLASMGAYALSRFYFRGGNQVLKVMFSSGILIPLNALMIPYFVLINRIGLYNTMGVDFGLYGHRHPNFHLYYYGFYALGAQRVGRSRAN